MHNLLFQFEYNKDKTYEVQNIFYNIIVKMKICPSDFVVEQNMASSENLKLELIDFNSCQRKGIINILSSESGMKFQEEINEFIKTCDIDNDFGIKIIYHSYGVEYMNDNRVKIANFEFSLRYLLTEILLEQWGNEFFALFDETFNIKEYINLDIEQSFKALWSYERIGLEMMYDFFEHHWLGGEEYKLLNKVYNEDIPYSEKKNEIKSLLQKDVFKDIKRAINEKFKKIKSIRNTFAHNIYIDVIEVNEFAEIELNTIIENLYSNVKRLRNEKKELNAEPTIEYIYLSNQDISIEDNLRLDLAEILLTLKIIIDPNSITFNSNENEIKYSDENYYCRLRTISVQNDDSMYIYIYLRSLDSTVRQSIFKMINEKKSLILFDSNSFNNSILIQNDISYVENLFRVYLNFLEYNNSTIEIPNNRIGMTSFTYKDEVIDNIFYNFDFIKLSEVYVNLGNRETLNFKKHLETAIKDDNEELINKLFDNIEDD